VQAAGAVRPAAHCVTLDEHSCPLRRVPQGLERIQTQHLLLGACEHPPAHGHTCRKVGGLERDLKDKEKWPNSPSYRETEVKGSLEPRLLR
jgi:hypothetical protein